MREQVISGKRRDVAVSVMCGTKLIRQNLPLLRKKRLKSWAVLKNLPLPTIARTVIAGSTPQSRLRLTSMTSRCFNSWAPNCPIRACTDGVQLSLRGGNDVNMYFW